MLDLGIEGLVGWMMDELGGYWVSVWEYDEGTEEWGGKRIME